MIFFEIRHSYIARRYFVVLVLLILGFSSCDTSNKLGIQKRRYTKGFYVQKCNRVNANNAPIKQSELHENSKNASTKKTIIELDSQIAVINKIKVEEYKSENRKASTNSYKKTVLKNCNLLTTKKIHLKHKSLKKFKKSSIDINNNAQLLFISLFILYLLLAYPWMLLFSVVFGVSLSPVFPLSALIFAFFMNGLVIIGAVYLFSDNWEDINKWMLLIVCFIILPAIPILAYLL